MTDYQWNCDCRQYVVYSNKAATLKHPSIRPLFSVGLLYTTVCLRVCLYVFCSFVVSDNTVSNIEKAIKIVFFNSHFQKLGYVIDRYDFTYNH